MLEKVWQQQAQESDEDYAKFLIYKDLNGGKCTLYSAELHWLKGNDKSTESLEKRGSAAKFQKLSRKFGWRDRRNAYYNSVHVDANATKNFKDLMDSDKIKQDLLLIVYESIQGVIKSSQLITEQLDKHIVESAKKSKSSVSISQLARMLADAPHTVDTIVKALAVLLPDGTFQPASKRVTLTLAQQIEQDLKNIPNLPEGVTPDSVADLIEILDIDE